LWPKQTISVYNPLNNRLTVKHDCRISTKNKIIPKLLDIFNKQIIGPLDKSHVI
jgi:hypothetical protein